MNDADLFLKSSDLPELVSKLFNVAITTAGVRGVRGVNADMAREIVSFSQIASEPVWTKDMAKPPIGAEAMLYLHSGVNLTEECLTWKSGDTLIVTYEINSELFVCYNKDRGTSSNVCLQYLKPLETPEEKYERECDEWARNKNNKMGLSYGCGIEIYKELKPFKENE